MASIVVSGDVLRRPRGGNLATHLHYLIGLRRLGHSVLYVEGRAEDPGRAVPREGLTLLREVLRRCRVDVPVVWVDPDAGLVGGMLWAQLRHRLADADVLLDIGGHCWLEERTLPGLRVLLDADTGDGSIASPARQLEHDVCFSYRRRPGAQVASEWQPTIPPVVPRLWYGPPARTALPVRVWADVAGAPSGDGGVDAPSSEQLLALPGRISPRPWTALPAARAALGERLAAEGWTVRPADEVEAGLSSYRSQVIGSQASISFRGEESARGIWFPSHDAFFLAAGRPVIALDDTLGSWLPTGSGLLTADGLDAAVAAVDAVQGALARHAAAARSIAERVFHFRVVLPSMLEHALPRARRLRAAA